MNEEAQARRQLDLELREALQHGEFVLHYQPQLELATGRFTGVEALILQTIRGAVWCCRATSSRRRRPMG